jgi:gliding motility-associated-like protein
VQAVDTGAVECRVTLHADNKDSRSTDTARLYVKKNPYNVALTKSASTSVFYVEDYRSSGSNQWPPSVTYTINVKNTGDSALHNVVVRDTLPAGIDTTSAGFPSSIAAVEPLEDGRTAVTFSAISTLNVQLSPTPFTIPCRVDTAIAAGSYRQYLNRAYVSCDEKEASTADNTDTALVEMRRELSLKVEVALCPPNTNENNIKPYAGSHEFRQGDTVEIWVSVTNVGKNAFTDPASIKLEYKGIAPCFSSVQGFTSISSTMPFITNTPRKVHSVVRVEKDKEFSISAIATVSSTGNPSFSVDDTSTVTGSILPGADMRVEVKVPPGKTDYDVKRTYTISMENIGKFRADTVTLRHTLDTLLESVDSIIFVSSGGENRYPVESSDQNIQLNEEKNEAIEYKSATRSLSYSIDFMDVNDSISVMLLVTTVTPSAEETLEIWPEASVEVASDIDYYLGNNRTHSNTPIIVQPNPYNVSISILPDPLPLSGAFPLTPKELRTTDMRNIISDDTASQVYTIKAKNIGKFVADSVEVFFEAGAGLRISEAEGSDPADTVGKIVRWSFEQLIPKDSSSFSVTVEAENFSAKGQQISHVEIIVGNGFDDGYPCDNKDTAYLNLFPVLSSWPIMEAFSPNNDHKNDVFKIPDLRSEVVERAELVIVNRYGSEVYSHSNYKNAQEDASAAFTGAGLPEGSYFYLLTIHFADKTVDKRGGTVAIRRSRWK